MAWYGEEREREMGTDKLLTAVQRARGPGPAPSLPPSGGWGCGHAAAELSLLAFLSIYLYIFLPSFLVGRAVSFSPSSLFSFSKYSRTE